jgi:hypothetical protein
VAASLAFFGRLHALAGPTTIMSENR